MSPFADWRACRKRPRFYSVGRNKRKRLAAAGGLTGRHEAYSLRTVTYRVVFIPLSRLSRPRFYSVGRNKRKRLAAAGGLTGRNEAYSLRTVTYRVGYA